MHINRILSYLPLIPKVIFSIKNPISFLMGYFKKKEGVINFWNGLKLNTSNSDDISSISVIFIKHEYGSTFGTKDRGLTIVDIGANKGYFSVLAANNKLNKVISYEPIRDTFRALEENVALNKLGNITVYNMGVAGENGLREFSYSKDTSIVSSMVFKAGEENEQIQCISLENVFIQNNILFIDVLKIDCEGAEFEIFYNSNRDTLSKIREIRMEYHNIDESNTHNINALTRYLEGNGFSLTKKIEARSNLGIAWFSNNTLN